MRWLRKGLNFACTQCGACCAIPEREVWINRQEVLKLTEALNTDVSSFLSRYTDANHEAKFRLKKGIDSRSCIFLDSNRRCSVHEHRPLQCSTYPFWPEHLISSFDWNAEAQMHCEGMQAVSIDNAEVGHIPERTVLKDMMQTELHRESEDFDSDLFSEFLDISDDQPLEEHADRFYQNNYRSVRYQKHHMTVIDTYLAGEDPKRSLVFTTMPSYVQTEIQLRQHGDDWRPCHRQLLQRPYQAMLLPMASHILSSTPHRKPIRVAVLGAGCGALANFLHSTLSPSIHIDAVDIDQEVLDVGASWFDFRGRPNLRIIRMDALDFLRSSELYDCIFLDIPSATRNVCAPAAEFCEDDVVQLIHRRLLPGGTVTINVIGGLTQLSMVHRCYRMYFPSMEALHLPDATVCYAYTSTPPPKPTLTEIQGRMDTRADFLLPLSDVLWSAEAHSGRFSVLSMGWLDTPALESL